MENQNEIIVIEAKKIKGEEISVYDDLRTLRKKRNQKVLREDCKVTITIVAYNRLEKTKDCVESVLKYTNIPYRLILADNGSDPEMMEYFSQVKHEDKIIIRVTENTERVASRVMRYYTNTEYMVGVTNDMVVTENWLKNLLTCAESDNTIGMVCPVSTNTSNLQEETLGGFSSLAEMQKKASLFNKSNPAKWEERMRLANVCVLTRTEAYNLSGDGDPGYYHDFGEDDLCIRMRRSGYKLILCKDTFVHHNHPRHNFTKEESEKFNASIESGKRAYMEKYQGLNPWEDFNNYLQGLVNIISFVPNSLHTYQVLGIDTRCGTPILDIRNLLRSKGCFQSDLYAFTTQAKYYVELGTICEEVISDKMSTLLNYYKENCFDFVVLGEPVNQYENPIGLVERLLKITKKDGTLLFPLKNTYDVKTFFNTIKSGCIPREEGAVIHLHCDDILGILKLLGIEDVKVSGIQIPIDSETQKIAMQVMEASKLLSKTQSTKSLGGLFVEQYWFCVRK